MNELEDESIECWENYTAGEVLVQGLAGQIHQQDVEAVIRAQKQMLQRFEKTNEMLSNCNSLSASRLAMAQQEFSKHSSTLNHAKKDLDYIFKKIRNIKTKLEVMYPQSFAVVQDKLLQKSNSEESAAPPSLSIGGASVSSQEEKTRSEETAITNAMDRLTCQDPSTSEASSRDSRSEGADGVLNRGGEQSAIDETADQDYEAAINAGKVRRVSGRLHHISSSDESSSNRSSTSIDS